MTKENFDLPLIGYNVIEECIKNGLTQQKLTSVFPRVSSASVNSLIELISHNQDTDLCVVKTDKHTVKKGQTLEVSCRLNHGPIDSDTPVLFEAEENSHLLTGLSIYDRLLTIKPGKATKIAFEIENTSKHNIVVPKSTLLGRIQLVQSASPVDVKLSEKTEPSTTNYDFSQTSDIGDQDIPKHVREIDIDGLIDEQKQAALRLLRQDQESFSKDDSEIGCLPELKLDIKLTDQTPVQKKLCSRPETPISRSQSIH